MKLDNKSNQFKIIDEYIEYLGKIKGYSKNTITSYKTDIKKYFEYINKNNKNYYEIEKLYLYPVFLIGVLIKKN